jgi:hypothetical protein
VVASEEAIAKGIRRIVALTGPEATKVRLVEIIFVFLTNYRVATCHMIDHVIFVYVYVFILSSVYSYAL